jgi:outer membrane biosynthesis protein TonB
MMKTFLSAALAIAAATCFAQQSPQTHARKSGVMLVSFSKPVYSPLARIAAISGEVVVEVTVHPDAKTEAVVVNGHPMLREAALTSARNSRFECRQCGASARYFMIYTFKGIEVANCCECLYLWRCSS